VSEQPEHVWYAAFGSNLCRQRFMRYIAGAGEVGGEPGCDDPSPPSDWQALAVAGRLWFGGYSERWGGGVAFLRDPRGGSPQAVCRAWRITRGQFNQVLAQENGRSRLPRRLDEGALRRRGQVDVLPGWYGRVRWLGEIGEEPLWSFTCPPRRLPRGRWPSDAYLATIIRGLRETRPDWGVAELTAYLSPALGPRYPMDHLDALAQRPVDDDPHSDRHA